MASLVVLTSSARANSFVQGTFRGEILSAYGFFPLAPGTPITGSFTYAPDIPYHRFVVSQLAGQDATFPFFSLNADGVPVSGSANNGLWLVNIYDGGRLGFSFDISPDVLHAGGTALVTYSIPDTGGSAVMLLLGLCAVWLAQRKTAVCNAAES